MKTQIQNLIFLVVIGVVGYFAYQYFLGSSQQISSTFNMYSLPEQCQGSGESLKTAFYRHEKLGNLTEVGLNGYKRNLTQCLRRNGYSGDQIDEAIDNIKNSR